MKTATWIIELYSDDEKTQLLFKKQYNNVQDITLDWSGLKKEFLYNCMKPARVNNIRKNKTYYKMKRIKITKTTHYKNKDDITCVYSI